MTKRRTKQQKLDDCYQAFKCIKEGRPVKRQGTKDGSIPTKPIMPVPILHESKVLKQCMDWLRKRGILADRNNVGAGQMGASGFYSYGVKGAGDIIGLLKTGQHFEIECKRGVGGRLSLEQQKRAKVIKENGGIYYVVHGLVELEYYFGEHINA